MAAELLPDELWQEIRPLLPPRPGPSPKGGRPPVDERAAVRGIIFVARTGIPWQALPTEVSGVSGSSCWRKLREWKRLGIWLALHRRLLNRLGRADGVDLDRGVADSQSVRALRGARTPAPTPWTAGNRGANATC
jgi:transposase